MAIPGVSSLLVLSVERVPMWGWAGGSVSGGQTLKLDEDLDTHSAASRLVSSGKGNLFY
jgi:hypothetical protein